MKEVFMKSADFCFKKGQLYAAALFCLALAAYAPAQVADQVTEHCEIRLTGCPADYDGKELTVPLSVITIEPKIRACGFQGEVASMGAAPAVMFIIDHSNSMTSNGGTPAQGGSNDVNGNRFRVTKALIDSIYKVYPNAEVGVVVFAGGLVFNATRDANLKPFEGLKSPSTLFAGENQSYLPLMTLNQPAKTGGTNPFSTAAAPNAIDVLRSMFAVTGNRGSIPGVPEIQGTDISIAFEAALEAFKNNAKAKENQYIIFLSDGAPGIGNETLSTLNCRSDAAGIPLPNENNPRCALMNEFTKGTNTPTTYTVFLKALNPDTPPLIAEMTENVKNNGYSSNNPKSNAWALESDYSALLTLMMDNIITPMLTKSEASAKTIVVSTPGFEDSTAAMGENFTFTRKLPIDTSAATTIRMGIKYDVQIDSLTASGRDTSWVIKDSLFNYSFTVRRSANPPGNWLGTQNLDPACVNPALDLQFGGKSLIADTVRGNMDRLTIIFDPNSTNKVNMPFTYNNVVVQVLNADDKIVDLENFTLEKGSDGKWRYTFPRSELLESDLATQGDNKLQNAGRDSIILVFRNPDIPLDTIRVSVPYINDPAYLEIIVPDKAGKKVVNGVLNMDEVKKQVKIDYLESNKEFAFENGVENAVFFAVLRDAWGNYKGMADGSNWTTITGSTPLIFVDVLGDSSSAKIIKNDKSSSDKLYVTAVKNDMADTVHILMVGEPDVNVGPNPFVPGVSSIMDRLNSLDPNGTVASKYRPIVEGSKQGVSDPKGILVAATAPRQVKENGGAAGNGAKFAKATAVIYDAVGNLVYRSKPTDIVIAGDGTTFGFVWDGKNMSGRTVGAGSYLMRMFATLTNGERFSNQRMIGVTVEGNVR
jgi:hypothetical protein